MRCMTLRCSGSGCLRRSVMQGVQFFLEMTRISVPDCRRVCLSHQFPASSPASRLCRSSSGPSSTVASLLLCASPQAAYTVINGRVVVREGQLATVELGPLLERHNRLAGELAGS